jgi:hypothetical protein
MDRYRFRSAAEHRPAATPAPSPTAFFLCPVACLPTLTTQQSDWQQALYQWAFEQAQAVVRPALPERDLLAAWN